MDSIRYKILNCCITTQYTPKLQSVKGIFVKSRYRVIALLLPFTEKELSDLSLNICKKCARLILYIIMYQLIMISIQFSEQRAYLHNS